MFCPVCKLEYRPGFTRCNDCDVPLVASLDDAPVPTNAPQDLDAPELLWTGANSAISAAIADALDAAQVAHDERTRDVGPLPGLSQPVYAIIIHARDHNAAQTVLESVRLQFEGAQTESRTGAAGGDSESSLRGPVNVPGGAEEANDPFAPEHDYVSEDFDPDEATCGVWLGADTDTENMLISCLRENGIGCAVDDSEAEHRICVMPPSEKRAREIIREVVEASAPPE
jgi:hypothetical protein